MSPVRDAERAAPAASPVDAPLPEQRFPFAANGSTGVRRGTVPVAAARPGRKRRRRRSLFAEVFRWLLTGLVFLALAGVVLMASLVAAIYWQARTDQTRPVDAIVVLGTAQFNGRPGRVLQARLDRALEVYETGDAPWVVVTGGRAPGDTFTEAEAARDYLLEQGVPAEAILMENEGRDSWESMRGVAALLGDLGLSRVLLVSDGFHLFRVKLMARDLGLTAFAAPAPESPIRRGGGREFSYVVREAAATVVHLWRTR